MFRADAFATLYLVHPLRKLFPSHQRRIPILMYHSISNASEQGHPYYRTVTTPNVFAGHMKYLAKNGYTTVSLSDAVKWLDGILPAITRPVAITFDDGYRDFYTAAFPVLSRHRFSATVYLPTAYIGNTTQTFKGIECLTWGEVRQLQAAGVEFGSHTVTHPQLKSLKAEAVRHEVVASKEAIEQALGCAVQSFAYPYAFPETNRAFTDTLRGFLTEAGYQNGVSTILGTADRTADRHFMKRLPMNSCDHDRLFTAKLNGAYDWLHKVQHGSKLLAGNR
jgi:peptidoglycan/xylan/chitin deacetylase (PgdA/CDA1 family)